MSKAHGKSTRWARHPDPTSPALVERLYQGRLIWVEPMGMDKPGHYMCKISLNPPAKPGSSTRILEPVGTGATACRISAG